MTESGTFRKVTRLDRPRTAAQLIAQVVDGAGPTELAATSGASRQAVTRFTKRHAAEIDDLANRTREAVEEQLIARKEERVKRLSALWDELIEFKAAHGLTVTETRRYGGAEVVVRAFNAALVTQLRGILDDVAKEVGERKPINVNVDNRQLTVIDLMKLARKPDEAEHLNPTHEGPECEP